MQAYRSDTRMCMHMLEPLPSTTATDGRHIPTMSAILGINGYLHEVDASWQHVLGWERADLLGMPLVARVHPDDLATMIAAFHHLYGGGAALTFQCRYLHRKGSYQLLNWYATPRLDDLVIDLVVSPVGKQAAQRQ